MKKAWVLSYPLSAQWRLWSDWADAQADLSSLGAHSFCWFCHVVAHIYLQHSPPSVLTCCFNLTPITYYKYFNYISVTYLHLCDEILMYDDNARRRYILAYQTRFFLIFTSADKSYITHPYPTNPWDRYNRGALVLYLPECWGYVKISSYWGNKV